MLLLVAVGAGLYFALSGEDEASAQTVTFQKPTETGDDPFTKPADVRRKAKVEVGSGRMAAPARISSVTVNC